jgi:myosin heavy subunit
MQQYLSAVKGAQLAPHPWSIAKRAFSNMVDEKRNQVVLISGESGAGKTVSTKIVLDYLTAASSSSCEGFGVAPE